MVYNISATYGLRKAYLCKPRHMYSRKTIYINIYIYVYAHSRYYILISWSCIYHIFRLHCTYCTRIYIYIHMYIYIYMHIYIHVYIYAYIYMYTQTLDIQRVLLSIFNIPHILCKIYSTNIFTYIVYITSTVDTVHVAYTIYIAAEKTPPSPATGGGNHLAGGGGGVGVPAHIYIYNYLYIYIYVGFPNGRNFGNPVTPVL